MLINRLGGVSEGGDPPRGDAFVCDSGRNDDDIADAIVEYGMRAHPTDLGVYLRGVPGLTQRLIALDAAIEMVLRGRCRLGATMEQAAAALVQEHGQLAGAIRRAAALSRVIDGPNGPVASVPVGDASAPRLTGRYLANQQPRYALHDKLGEGSEAVVYLAMDRAFSDPEHPAWVAVKKSRTVLRDGGDDVSDESERARRIVHPNVVRVLDRFLDDDGHVCHVFEYVRGGDLHAWRRAFPGRVPVRDAVELVRRVAAGVQAVHGVGLVHRDLKPSNVLVTESGVPRITDFGIARPTRSDAASSARQGSLAFVAPEQFRGDDGAVTVTADVYGLGGLLYWLLTDEYPNSSTVEGVLERFAGPGGVAPSPATKREGVDPDLDAICRRALSTRPEDRYASADALGTDLDRWMAFEPLMWRETSLKRRAALLFRRHPRSLPIAGAAVLLGVAALVVGVLMFGMARVKDAELTLEAERTARREENVAAVEAKTKAMDMIFTMIRDQRSTNTPSLAWLNAMTFLESVVGPLIVTPGNTVTKWSERISVAEVLSEKYREGGQQDQLEAMLLESCLCVWLIHDDRSKDALVRLPALIDRWEQRVAPNDPWLVQLRVIEMCAKASGGMDSEPLAARLDTMRQADELSKTLSPRPLALRMLVEQGIERLKGVAPAK